MAFPGGSRAEAAAAAPVGANEGGRMNECECEVAQSCPILCDLMDYSPPGSSVHGDSPEGKTTGVGCHAFVQGIFPTQGSNPGLPHCRQTLYHLSHSGAGVERRALAAGVPSRAALSLSPHPGRQRVQRGPEVHAEMDRCERNFPGRI